MCHKNALITPRDPVWRLINLALICHGYVDNFDYTHSQLLLNKLYICWMIFLIVIFVII